MTTLDNGVVIDESIDAVHVTRAADVPAVFKQGPRRVENITIHWWGVDGNGQPLTAATFNSNRDYLASDNDRESSTHYIACDGRVACLVTPDDAAWHAGTAIGNTVSVGIECCPMQTTGDYNTIASLIRFIRSIYGDIPLVPHRAWIGTDCPGGWDLLRLDALARHGGPAPTPAPAPAPPAPGPVDENRIHWVVEAGDTLGHIAEYYGGPSVAQIAAFNGIPDPDRISVGQVIYIPGPLVWDVEAGDTLTAIAGYYGMTAETVAANNGIDVNATIYPGQVLRILN